MAEKLTKKQKAAIRKAKEADIDSKMRKKVAKDWPTYEDPTLADPRTELERRAQEVYQQALQSEEEGGQMHRPRNGMKKGGMVRGHGCAKRGHKKLRMR